MKSGKFPRSLPCRLQWEQMVLHHAFCAKGIGIIRSGTRHYRVFTLVNRSVNLAELIRQPWSTGLSTEVDIRLSLR